MLTALRTQVQSALYAVPAKRKPALRRSDLADALFATDLPLVADAAQVEAFCIHMTEQSWRCGLHNGWLTLDAPIPAPAAGIPDAPSGECGCCISLLLRHSEDAPADDLIRAVVKAADAGRQPFERLCGQLHAAFAERLRRHEKLPGALLHYLCQAYQTFYQ